MLKSKFFRIAVEGDTTDGRVIQRSWLEEMAATYNPEKYTAIVNCEHIRGLMPDGPFGSFGNVVELKGQEDTIDGEKKYCLYASIAPNQDMVELSRKGKKLFPSMEIDYEFSGTDKAYLMGVAMTDTPASLGTEMMLFAAGAKNNPFTSRKKRPENLFTAAVHEVELEFEDDSSLLDRITSMFKKQDKKNDQQEGQNTDFTQAIEAIAGEVVKVQEEFSNLKNAGSTEEVTALKGTLETLETNFNALKDQLEKEPGSQFKQRPPAAGGEGNQELTDC